MKFSDLKFSISEPIDISDTEYFKELQQARFGINKNYTAAESIRRYNEIMSPENWETKDQYWRHAQIKECGYWDVQKYKSPTGIPEPW